MALLSIVQTIGDHETNLGEFAVYALLGFCIVVATLIVLIFILTLFSKGLNSKLISSIGQEKPKKIKTEVNAKETLATLDEDEETVAAITAALYAFYEVNSATVDEIAPPFIIKSIKKK